MKDWKHLILEQRKVIASGIAHNYKLKDIGESLGFDPTSISKEVKRNRIEVSMGLKNDCKRTKRWPYVCTGCNKRYNNCPYTKYKYDAKKAQEKADINLVNSRRGIDITSEFKQLDAIIKNGINSNIWSSIEEISNHYEGTDVGSMCKIILKHGDFELFYWMLDPIEYSLENIHYDFFKEYTKDDQDLLEKLYNVDELDIDKILEQNRSNGLRR